MQEEGREAQRFAQPVRHVNFHFCASRASNLSTPIKHLHCLFVLFGISCECCVAPYPGKNIIVHGICQHASQQGGPWGQEGVVAMHVRALPVNDLGKDRKDASIGTFSKVTRAATDSSPHSRHDDFLKVVQDRLPLLWLCRRAFWEKILHVSRLHVRHDFPLPDGAHVLGDVVHQLFTWTVAESHRVKVDTARQISSCVTLPYLCGCILQPACFSKSFSSLFRTARWSSTGDLLWRSEANDLWTGWLTDQSYIITDISLSYKVWFYGLLPRS